MKLLGIIGLLLAMLSMVIFFVEAEKLNPYSWLNLVTIPSLAFGLGKISK